MRLLLFLILNFAFLVVNAQLEQTRTLFFSASNDEGIKKFYSSASSIEESSGLTLNAYKATATAMYAGIALGVSKKIAYFNEGKVLLEKSVNGDWYNAEIRFLRFSVQSEIPLILGYSGNLKEDADIIIQTLEKNSFDWKISFWQKAINFMIDSGELSSDQSQKLKKFKLA